MNKPPCWTIEQLCAADLGRTALWGAPERAAAVMRRLVAQPVGNVADISAETETLIVIGGGTRLDAAKVWRSEHRPALRLVAIPSLWGSGAEASPVAVLDHRGTKEIRIGGHLLPDIRCILPELAVTIPDDLARYGFGDVWSHALEGFLSPLASAELRAELAGVMGSMLAQPVTGNDPHWFELSAQACSGQARSGVGLVHGIAHVMEGPLRELQPDAGWGHARLCSLFIYPVMRFNRHASDTFDALLTSHGLDPDRILARLQTLYSCHDFNAALPSLTAHWKAILRDRCTRVNSVLARPQSLAYFAEKAFLQ